MGLRMLSINGVKPFWFILLVILLTFTLSACGSSASDFLVGDQAPEFTLNAADGSTVSLSDYAGEPVLLYFHMAMG
jgi:cytochrome oxidase Cu insertion factor (SCO1/SenC/PrrC family)